MSKVKVNNLTRDLTVSNEFTLNYAFIREVYIQACGEV